MLIFNLAAAILAVAASTTYAAINISIQGHALRLMDRRCGELAKVSGEQLHGLVHALADITMPFHQASVSESNADFKKKAQRVVDEVLNRVDDHEDVLSKFLGTEGVEKLYEKLEGDSTLEKLTTDLSLRATRDKDGKMAKRNVKARLTMIDYVNNMNPTLLKAVFGRFLVNLDPIYKGAKNITASDVIDGDLEAFAKAINAAVPMKGVDYSGKALTVLGEKVIPRIIEQVEAKAVALEKAEVSSAQIFITA